MELVLETLKEKKFYLEYKIKQFIDYTEITEKLQENVKEFERTIDLIEYFINVSKNK